MEKNKLLIEIDVRNAAYVDNMGQEIDTNLNEIVGKIQDGATAGFIQDGNGNNVGHWEFTE